MLQQAGPCQVHGQTSRMGQLKAMHSAWGNQVLLPQAHAADPPVRLVITACCRICRGSGGSRPV